MNLTLAIKEVFEGNEIEVYWNERNEPVMVIDQLAKALDYADRKGIENIISRNEYLRGIEFSTTHRLSVVEGGRGVTRERRIFNEDGIYEITMLSTKPKAKQFRAFVRKILKALRKGETVLVQPQSDHDKLQIQKQRAEAMLLNARTRQAKLILDLQKNKLLSPIAVELLQINALEKIIDKPIDQRPQLEEKHYSATEVGSQLGINARKVGIIANSHNLKTEQYGIWVLDKSKYSNKQVNNFLYNQNGIKKIGEIVEGAK